MDWTTGQGQGTYFFFLPTHPDWLWGPPSLLSNRYRGPFPRGKLGDAWIL